MRQIAFMASAGLALAGVALAVGGIMNESFKAAIIGMVLIFAAGVFATLYLGSRPHA